MAQFVLQFGDHSVRLTPGIWRVGRDPTCEIHLNDDSVSRRHAVFRVHEDRVTLSDQGSRNGIRVNDRRVHFETTLRPGDHILVGAIDLRLRGEDSSEHTLGPMPPTRPLPKLGPPVEGELEGLSPRERTVLERLAHGMTQRQIAEELGVSVKTVETYRARLARKLGLRTRADLVRFALDTGILRGD